MSEVIPNNPTEIQRCLQEAARFEAAFHKLGAEIEARRCDPSCGLCSLCELSDLYSELQAGILIAKEKYHGETKV